MGKFSNFNLFAWLLHTQAFPSALTSLRASVLMEKGMNFRKYTVIKSMLKNEGQYESMIWVMKGTKYE